MKKLLLSAILLFCALGANAQVYLSKNYEPVEKRKYNPTYPGVKNYENYMNLTGYEYTNGFKLPNGVLNSQAEEWGYAVFSLKGQYEKISFVVGLATGNDVRFNAADDGTHIVTVRADGRRIFDEVIRDWAPPREVMLDISGVDEIRFDHLKGLYTIGFAEVRLWKKGETPKPALNPLANVITRDKVNLVDDIQPHFLCHRGWSVPVTVKHRWPGIGVDESIKMNRIDYNSGFRFGCSQEFGKGISQGFAYFWLQKQYDKVSFLIGPKDANSSNSKGWFTVKADGRIIYEKLITQEDLVEQVVLDVAGVNVLSMHSGELEQSDFLGGLDYGVVDIYAYKKGYAGIPTPGIANTAREKISKFKDATPLCSSLEPYSVRGIANFKSMYFNGASSYYHFSMGGEQFDEGFILTTGNSFMNGNISSYVEYDLAGEFDWLSFTVGTLSNHRVLGEDRLQVYADDALVLDTQIHCLWPNQKFTIPIGKCRRLKFAKAGTGLDKQTYIGVGDVMVFRGEPQDTAPYFYHRKPEITHTADLIDLCERPYFHYVGRYLSNLTNFDFNDCFKNGSSLKERFDMKDGSQIYKGIMLETNIPPAMTFEDISLEEAIFMMILGAGSSISASDVAAVTGVSAGAGLAGALAGGYAVLNLVDNKHQSAMAAFNPYGEYESLTFTVANKSAYVDTDLFGRKADPENPVDLYVFADMRKVGEFRLTNNMKPTTYSVPLNHCTQLVFWLQCGDSRSGQYVLYDMTVSKDPCTVPESQRLFSSSAAGPAESAAPSKSGKSAGASKSRGSKAETTGISLEWTRPDRSGNKYVDDYFKDVETTCKETAEYEKMSAVSYREQIIWLTADDGSTVKAVTFVDRSGKRLSVKDLISNNNDAVQGGANLVANISVRNIGAANAALGLPELGLAGVTYGKYLKTAKNVMTDCSKRVKAAQAASEEDNQHLNSLWTKRITVDGRESTHTVIFMNPEPGDKIPSGPKQLVRYFSM